MYEKLVRERQELINFILLTQQTLANTDDDVERKHIRYQLAAMADYQSALEQRILIHQQK